MLNNVLPVDVYSAKEFGIDKWQESFVWPVSDSFYASMCEDIWEAWRIKASDRSTEVGNAFLVKFNIAIECQHLLHAAAVIKGAKKMELNPSFHKGSFWYRDLLSSSVENEKPGVLVKKAVTYRPGSFMDAAYTSGKKIVRGAWYNASPKKMTSALKSGERVCVYGVPDERIQAYMKTLSSWVHVTYERDWLSMDERHESIDASIVESGSSGFIADVREISARHGIELSESQFARFEKFVFDELVDSMVALNRIRARVSRMGPIHLLVQQFGDPVQRALSIVVREGGGKVTGFSHGGAIGLFDSPTFSMSEFSLADVFITFSSASVPMFEAIRDSHKTVRDNVTEIRSINTNYYRDYYSQYRRRSFPEQIKKVMVLGYPYHPWRKAQSSGGLALLHLDMERNIVKALHDNGYEILYKAHPDRLSEASGIFDDYATVLTEEFRDCVDQVDAIVIGSLKTSALPFALCTNKPIVAVAVVGQYKMHADAFDLLKKRCSVIEVGFDERGRIDVSGGDVCDLLSGHSEEPNMEFVKRYLLPQ